MASAINSGLQPPPPPASPLEELIEVCREGDVEKARNLILRHQQQLHASDTTKSLDLLSATDCGETPLIVASRHGHVALVKELLELGADVSGVSHPDE